MTRALTAVFWTSFALGAVIYATMIGWTLPAITAAAGGLAPFDMRPGGYSLQDAQAFVTALSPEGKALYLGPQHQLDLAYPLLLGVMVFAGLVVLAPAAFGNLKWVLGLAALPGTIFDWQENALVARMIDSAGPLDAQLVVEASRATLTKSVSTTIALTLLLALFVAWAWRRWRKSV